MDILNLLKKYNKVQSLKTGTTVLIDGFDNNGIYVIQCEVTKINGDKVEAKEVEKYYLSGKSINCSGDTDIYEKNDLLKPISERLIENHALIQWLSNQFNKTKNP